MALVIFFSIFFIVGLYARDSLRGVNKLFDEELSKNTIMICEEQNHLKAEASSVETVVESLTDQKQALTMKDAIDAIRIKYKKRSRYGLVALAIAPTLLLVIMAIYMAFVNVDVNTKLIWMFI